MDRSGNNDITGFNAAPKRAAEYRLHRGGLQSRSKQDLHQER
jgi:hypothetical protein